ncbi:hypothetical protein [Microbulbifer zhoushanensis]|uniref:hypothetical protein n=1 Tax=Microbulbifer zhoushanensis TaxID=2904254 RepID=UPI001F38CA27|nr:hypothetical protein [Microbulbifer zhoushanensis]
MLKQLCQKLFLLTSGAFLLLAAAGTNAACDPDALLQACDFDSPYSVTLQGATAGQAIGAISFRVTSKRPKNKGTFQASKYSVIAYAEIGTEFSLVSQYGDSMPLVLTYNNWNGNFAELAPSTSSGQLNGTTTFQPASLQLAISDTATALRPGTYTGGIRLLWQPANACKECVPFTETIDIAVTIPATIAISGLDDVSIDYPASSNSQAFCVTTSAGLDFNIRADSDTGSGSFILEGLGVGDRIEYRVAAGSVGGSPVDLVEGIPSAAQWPGDPLDNCGSGGENMQLVIAVDSSALESAVETAYTDKLTITVEVQ